MMQQVTATALKDWIRNSKSFMLIDVREEWERNAYNIGGEHIPMGNIMAAMNELPQDKEIVFYCEKGIRSVIVIQRLEDYGFEHLFNLAGGMKAWKEAGLDTE